MNATVQHMKTQGAEYFIAGNGVTHSFCSGEGVMNHKEEETAIILGLSEMEWKQQKVVYGSDVDLFLLLLAHYDNIECIGI